jgi:large subunit ribosomal protein L6
MSRIGKKPIGIPKDVTVIVEKNEVQIKGPKGVLSQWIDPKIEVEVKDNLLHLKRFSDQRLHRAFHGLYRALLSNMIIGVSKGYKRSLTIVGIGYRAKIDGKTLVLNVGHSHPIRYDPPAGITIICEKQDLIEISGIDKQLVGQVAAIVRGFRSPEPYKGKGIRYLDEVVKHKAGKSGA